MRLHFTEHSVFELHPLVIRKEGSKYIIGREDTEIYVIVEPEGYKIIELLKKYKTIHIIRKKLAEDFNEYNVKEFIHKIIGYGFVKRIDKHIIGEKHKVFKPMLQKIQKKHISWLFSPYMYILYACIFLFALFILCYDQFYFPTKEDVFFHHNYSMILIYGFIAGWVLLGLHELAHLVAAKSRGIGSAFGISSRFYYLVAITDITNVYKLPPIKRLRIFLAGICLDLLIASVSIILMFFSDLGFLGMSSTFYRFLRFIVLVEFIGVLWQFLFYMKTDMYYVYETLSSCYNINEKAAVLLGHFFRRLNIFPKKYLHGLESYFFDKSEKKKVVVYCMFYLFGLLLMIYITFIVFIPVTIQIFKGVITKLYTGIVMKIGSAIIDSVVFLAIYLFEEGLFVYAFVRKHKLYLKSWYYWTMIVLVLLSYFFVAFFVIISIVAFASSFLFMLIYLLILGIVFGVIETDLIMHMNKHIPHKRINADIFLFILVFLFAISMSLLMIEQHIYAPLIVALCFVVGKIFSYPIVKVLRIR